MSTSFYPISCDELVSQDLNSLKRIAQELGFKMIENDGQLGVVVPIDHSAFSLREHIECYLSGDFLEYPSNEEFIDPVQCYWMYPNAENRVSFMTAGGSGLSPYHALATIRLLFECDDSLCEHDDVELLELAGIF